MKYYVFHRDDYPGNGGLGLEEFDDATAATEFIENRISQDPKARNLSNYTLIHGTYLCLVAVQTVMKVKIV